MYFSMDTPSGPSKEFQRHAYQLLDDSTLTLVHYIGDEKATIDFPHRNATSDKFYVRTCPSYLKKCETLVKDSKANVVYKKEIASMCCDPSQIPVQTPRNIKQLRNLRFKHLNKLRISQDALYNLHEIAYDIPGFVWKITTFPDLTCICGLQELLEEFDRVLSLDTSFQLLSYDTTFQLGDFYVSPLVFRHSVFQERPCIPAMFLVHERKFTDTHKEMFKVCKKHIPSLNTTTSSLVVDKERAIVNAIKSEIPQVALLNCWNHIFQDIRLWCRKHALTTDTAMYLEDVRQLFHSCSQKDYEKSLAERRSAWDAAFEAYFLKEIHPDVGRTIGRWILEDLNVYNPYSGVTNNQSESLNR